MPREYRLSSFQPDSEGYFSDAFDKITCDIRYRLCNGQGDRRFRILVDVRGAHDTPVGSASPAACSPPSGYTSPQNQFLPVVSLNRPIILPRTAAAKDAARITIEGEDPSVSILQLNGPADAPLITWETQPVMVGDDVSLHFALAESGSTETTLRNLCLKHNGAGPLIHYPLALLKNELLANSTVKIAELRDSVFENLVLQSDGGSSTLMNLDGILWVHARNLVLRGGQNGGTGIRMYGSYGTVTDVVAPGNDAPTTLLRMQSGQCRVVRARTEGYGNHFVRLGSLPNNDNPSPLTPPLGHDWHTVNLGSPADYIFGRTDPLRFIEWASGHRLQTLAASGIDPAAGHTFFVSDSLRIDEKKNHEEADEHLYVASHIEQISGEGKGASKACILLSRCAGVTVNNCSLPSNGDSDRYAGIRFNKSSMCRVTGGMGKAPKGLNQAVVDFDRESHHNSIDRLMVLDAQEGTTLVRDAAGTNRAFPTRVLPSLGSSGRSDILIGA